MVQITDIKLGAAIDPESLESYGRRRPVRYPFDKLELSAFFHVIEDAEKDSTRKSTLYQALQSSRKYWEAKTGHKFSISRDNIGIRVVRYK